MKAAVLFLSGLLSACATRGASLEQRQAHETALRAVVECAHRNAAIEDDGISDASTIALALSVRCGREYSTSIDAAAPVLMPNNEQASYLFRRKSATADAKVQFFLPIVVKHRNQGR